MSQQLVLDTHLDTAKSTARWLYIFHGACLLLSLGLFSFIPMIVNYIKRGETTGTFVYSHHTWQIRSFWWYAFWIAVGVLPFITIIGIPLAWLIWTCAWLWKAYRLVRGISDLNQNRAMPV
ncbi:hypothetical protein [Rugamonas sp.]|uniref:DUF4870 family protein n=1 Tax=Rugamonas sp. TaxID=1926287 RepID=UPI0025F153E3|nr:hypothetical protein [Rugamonas sp.]